MLPTVCCVCRLLASLIDNMAQLQNCFDIYELQGLLYLRSWCCASAYRHWKENMPNMLLLRLKRLTTTRTSGVHYALSLEGIWTNPLVFSSSPIESVYWYPPDSRQRAPLLVAVNSAILKYYWLTLCVSPFLKVGLSWIANWADSAHE